MFSVKQITDRSKWDKFLATSSYNYFLQSWEWGEFQTAIGAEILRLGVFSDDNLVAVCLALIINSRFGKCVYCPRGPILEWSDPNLRKSVLNSLTAYFNTGEYIFLRLDPAIKESDTDIVSTFDTFGFRPAVNFTQVERAWMLDIKGKSDEELLSGMRKNTRYYVKRAANLGVNIRFSEDPTELPLFTDMINIMAKRKGFKPFSETYFKNQFEILSKAGYMKLLLAEYNSKVLATALIVFYGNEGSYLHAASADIERDTQAPYLLQWEAVKHAREKGCDRYNFWGVVKDEDYQPSHPGFGYSNFKKGFGGYLEKYMRTRDFVYKSLPYQLIRLQDWYRMKQNKAV